MNADDALARSYAELYPAEVARILETRPEQEVSAFVASLPALVRAQLLGATSPSSAAHALLNLPAEGIREVVPLLGLKRTAALMQVLSGAERKRLLGALRQTDAEQLAHLSHYGPQCAGGIMDPKVDAVPDTLSVADTLARVRAAPQSALYYVYGVGERQELTGVATLRELMTLPGGTPFQQIMTKSPDRLRADDPIRIVVQHPAWLRVHALPVVDGDDRLLGAVRYSGFRNLEREVGRALASADATQTAMALAELYSVSATALLRWAGFVLSQGAPERDHS